MHLKQKFLLKLRFSEVKQQKKKQNLAKRHFRPRNGQTQMDSWRSSRRRSLLLRRIPITLGSPKKLQKFKGKRTLQHTLIECDNDNIFQKNMIEKKKNKRGPPGKVGRDRPAEQRQTNVETNDNTSSPNHGTCVRSPSNIPIIIKHCKREVYFQRDVPESCEPDLD